LLRTILSDPTLPDLVVPPDLAATLARAGRGAVDAHRRTWRLGAVEWRSVADGPIETCAVEPTAR
jgi:hypothetical protein